MVIFEKNLLNMSSKSSRHRRQRDYSESESESGSDTATAPDRESKRHHHHRRERHEKRDHRRSRSRSRSPGHHRTTKPDKHSSRNHKEHSHSRDEDHKPQKHRDQGNGDRRRERHQEERIKEDKDEHRAKHRRRDGDHDAGRSGRSKNGNHKEKEELPKIPLRGKWENDPGAESDDAQDKASRTNQGAAQQTNQIRVKQERDLNDARRTQDAKRKPQNPFESQALDAGPEEEESAPPPEKEKPNFGVSGKLTEDSNTYRGVVIKYNEPPEARIPKRKWRFYVFKGDEELPVVHIHRQSAYLLGRERLIADLPIDHPSCSKQHAVLQYRLVEFQRPDGTMGKRVRPYIIDLESSNGTYINNNRIEGKRYYELKEKDVVKFGYSTREYVLLHDKSKDSDLDEEQAE